jgi:hypothetical protein
LKVRIKSTSRQTSTETATIAMTIMATLPDPHKLQEEPWVEPQEALREAQDQQAFNLRVEENKLGHEAE